MLHLFCSLNCYYNYHVVLGITPEACVKYTNATDPIGLHVPLTATCIAVGCKTSLRSDASSSYNRKAPCLNLLLIRVSAYLCVYVVNIKDSPDIAVDISDCVDCPADAVLTSSCVYFGAAIITNMVDLDVFF